MKIKHIAIFLVLLCCIMGTASASEDITMDSLDATIDDGVVVDATPDDASGSVSTEPSDTISDDMNEDAFIESESLLSNDANEEQNIKNDENEYQNLDTVDESNEIGTNRDLEYWGTEVEAEYWWELYDYASNYGEDYIITLTGTEYEIEDPIDFYGCMTIIGNSEAYITGDTPSIAFTNTRDSVINFINVTFKDINSNVLIKIFSSYRNTFDNCTFINVTTTNYEDPFDHSSVIWNYGGLMNITNCKFINCTNGFGVITNHINATFGVDMFVDNCTFINNYGRTEPGAINNCGNLTVTNSNFTNNSANWWAGAIHTHYGANTLIQYCNFTNNFAGWNGGALYAYGNLSVLNSNFINNSCNRSSGGGAIGASEWDSNYNIYVCECLFENNSNICNLDNETPTLSNGGAISALNTGILEVVGSTFINNFAQNGQAISAYSAYYPDMHYGLPNVIIAYNTFEYHNDTSSDTVALEGEYIFEHNNFTYCNQVNRNGSYNQFINCTPSDDENDGLNPQSSNKVLSKNILGDSIMHDKIYINISNADDKNYKNDDVDGQSWENAYNSYAAITYAISKLNNEGIIYIAGSDPDSARGWGGSANKNITFIGENRDTTIFNYIFTSKNSGRVIQTFINMTFHQNRTNSKGVTPIVELSGNNIFINCTFIDSPIFFTTFSSGAIESSLKSYNCDFINSNRLNNGNVSAYVLSTADSNFVEFYDCLFENMTYDSVFYSSSPQLQGVSIYNSTFKNCNVNGIVDIPGNVEIDDSNCRIEDCDYDFDAAIGVVSADEYVHNYVNATKLKIVPVDSAVDISSSEKGVVVIALTDNSSAPIAGATFKYTVNGGEEQTNTTGEDGKFTISGLTGEVTIAVSYEGNESFNPITGNKAFSFTEEPVANDTNSSGKVNPSAPGSSTVSPSTKITKVASKFVAKKKTFKVKTKVKKYTITLKTKAGKAIKKVRVTLKVKGKTYKATTNKKGKAVFKIKNLKKKGKFTAKLKFAGNKNYKASTKKVRLSVK